MKTTQQVNKGDYFRLNSKYSPSQRKHVMQVMEVADNRITVKSGKNKCMTKTLDEFEFVSLFSNNDVIHVSPYFEDLRN